MDRRNLIAALGMIVVPWPRGAAAQEQLPRIGFLDGETAEAPHPELDAFVAGLSDYHRIEGETILIERRLVGTHRDWLRAGARDLVAHDVAVIVAFAPAIDAAMGATTTIPIVIRSTVDPVAAGYVKSLARPGGNVTGVSSYTDRLFGKRLELLRELVPGIARVGVVWNDRAGTGHDYFATTEAAAKTLGLAIVSVTVHDIAEFTTAIATAKEAGAGGILPLRDPLVVGGRARLAALAASAGLPAIYDDREFCDAGGLASYGSDLAALHRRAAYFVDRILSGVSPADLPIEQPTKFELVLNLKAAKALGLAISPMLLARADDVME